MTSTLGARALLLLAISLAACDDKPATPAAPTIAAPTIAAPPTMPSTASTAGAATQAATTTAPAPPHEDTPAKTYDCGAKDQKPCPMQRWMKRVMAPASAARDADALAKALGYVADHVPPGFTDWSSMAKGAAAKAKAGDVDGAKASCKQCHDQYKDKYKSSMRDRPF